MKKILNYFLGIIFFALSSLYYLELLIIKMDVTRANNLLEQLESNENYLERMNPWELMLRGSSNSIVVDEEDEGSEDGEGSNEGEGSSIHSRDEIVEKEYSSLEEGLPGEDVIDSYLIRRQMVTGTPIKKIVGESNRKKKQPMLRRFKSWLGGKKKEVAKKKRTMELPSAAKSDDAFNKASSSETKTNDIHLQNEEADQRTYQQITHRIIQLLMERKELLSTHKSTTKVDELIQWNESRRRHPQIQDLTGKTYVEISSYLTELVEEQKQRVEAKMDTKEVEKEMARMKRHQRHLAENAKEVLVPEAAIQQQQATAIKQSAGSTEDKRRKLKQVSTSKNDYNDGNLNNKNVDGGIVNGKSKLAAAVEQKYSQIMKEQNDNNHKASSSRSTTKTDDKQLLHRADAEKQKQVSESKKKGDGNIIKHHEANKGDKKAVFMAVEQANTEAKEEQQTADNKASSATIMKDDKQQPQQVQQQPQSHQPHQPEPQPQQNEEADKRTYQQITHRIIQLLNERKELLSSHKSTKTVDELIQWNESKRHEAHVQDLTGKTYAEVTSYIDELVEERKQRLEMKMDCKEVEKEIARMKEQQHQLADQRTYQQITHRILQLLAERKQLVSSHKPTTKVDELIQWNESKRRDSIVKDDLTGKTYVEITLYIDELVEERKERVTAGMDWKEVGKEISRMNEARWKLR